MLGGKSYEIFRLFGFPVRIHPSWLVILALVTWSLAVGWFPTRYEGLGTGVSWTMGLLGALTLFASLVAHELAHALMARRYEMPMEGITLFMFGGVAQMTDEPPSAEAEFWVAVAGPLASIGIAVSCWVLTVMAKVVGLAVPVVAVLEYLALMNVVLVVFNAAPAFPLDGGRVLRSALWQWKGDLRWATRIATVAGGGFGWILIALGVLQVIGGNLIGGIWLGLIGMFLRTAAQSAYQQLLVRRMLEGEPVRRFMNDAVVSVPRQISVRELIDEYVYRHHFKLFPVVDGGRLVGTVSTQQVEGVPREEWENTPVSQIALPCTRGNTVGPNEDAMDALAKMRREGISRLPVVTDAGELVGILALKDLLELFELKVELEGG